MEWIVRREKEADVNLWRVYKICGANDILKKSFATEDEARAWAREQEDNDDYPRNEKLGKVDEAAAESFPASDPPSWTKTVVHITDTTKH